MRKSVVEAVREGLWDFEPGELHPRQFDCTYALPGSAEKVEVMALRAERGLPLWHLEDRLTFDGLNE